MLHPEDLHGYQIAAISHIIRNPRAMLWLEMSLGKTVTTLTAIEDLTMRLEVFGAIVFGPVRVVETVWKQEAEEWSHLQGMRFALIRGTERQRIRALHSGATVYLANYELAPWLIQAVNRFFLQRKRYPPFTMAVFDEISKCKNSTGQRAKLLRALMPYCPRRVGLTGTPASNGYKDLHGQYLMLDDGDRLFTTKKQFTETYLKPVHQGPFAKHVLAPGAGDRIRSKIRDITFALRSTDVIKLPDLQTHDIEVVLPPGLRETYEKFEKEYFLEIEDRQVEVFNQAALNTKCRQFANGLMYDPNGSGAVLDIHDLKLSALEDIIEEAAGKPILLAYVFRIDMVRIIRHFEKIKGFQIGYMGPAITEDPELHKKYYCKDSVTIKDRWNSGAYNLLCMHPASAGHGLNLQAGGNHIVWYGVDWNLEYYEQAIYRLRRQRQKASYVLNHRIVCPDTLEDVVRAAIHAKTREQDGLKDDLSSKGAVDSIMTGALQEYRKHKQH